jgi:hypothetical protein
MLSGRNPASVSARVLVCAFAFAGPMSIANVASAQTTQLFPVRGEEVTPIGALPPIALPMPARTTGAFDFSMGSGGSVAARKI